MTKKITLTCKHPDRDSPKLMCAHPLPCPWHTVIIDTSANPPTITFPITSNAIHHREELAEIADALKKGLTP